MENELARFWNDLISRPAGPMGFRFILQPLMAILLAIRDGRKDAKTGRTPYLQTIVKDKRQRRALLREGWASVAKVFFIAVALDVIYQIAFLRALHPLESLAVAFTLACLPFILARGPVNRLTRRWMKRH